LNDAKANTFLVGAAIPLPIFDRNQGSIQEAKIRFDQKKREYYSVKNRLTLQLNVLYKRLKTLIETADQLSGESIPEAEEAFKIIKQGNLVGRFAIIDVLDAERTLFELQNQYLNIVGQIHSTQIEIEGLIAKEIN
jgi:cobalt-zinc-cadmium efflux system outer membrane protein